MRVVALFSLATGMLTAWATGHWHQHELEVLQSLWQNLDEDEVLLADRGFSVWAVLARCLAGGIHGVFRLRRARKLDFRSGKRLGPNDRLIHWRKGPIRPPYLDPAQWAQFPDQLLLRMVRCRLSVRGFRTREVIIVTTLIDPVKYPCHALGQLYLRRWEMELTLRNLKTTLQMEHLSCKNPDNIERELRMHFLVHNLVRRLMLESARRHRTPLDRISFAGALAAARRYGEAMLQSPTQRVRRALFEELLRVLANDTIPYRPGRREPRAVKRRPKPYTRLMRHRRFFHEIPHQNRYWAGSPCKRKP
jgi:hypothetical protein